MDYTITRDDTCEIVRLTVFRTSPEGHTLQAAAQTGRDAGWHRFLLDYTGEDVGAKVWVFSLAARLDALGFRRRDRIALVPCYEGLEWAQLVATNRGWEVATFESVAQAEAWLLTSPSN